MIPSAPPHARTAAQRTASTCNWPPLTWPVMPNGSWQVTAIVIAAGIAIGRATATAAAAAAAAGPSACSGTCGGSAAGSWRPSAGAVGRPRPWHLRPQPSACAFTPARARHHRPATMPSMDPGRPGKTKICATPLPRRSLAVCAPVAQTTTTRRLHTTAAGDAWPGAAQCARAHARCTFCPNLASLVLMMMNDYSNMK